MTKRLVISMLLAGLACAGAFPAAARASADSERPLVTFFYGGISPDDSWTVLITAVGRSAAEDLGLDFETVFSGPGRKEQFDTVSRRIETGRLPDYILLVNYRGGAEIMLQRVNDAGIGAFLINADISEEEAARIRGPREKLPHWIGRLIPDDEQAGYDLATTLFDAARRRHPGKELSVVGLSGSYASTAATKRNDGLRRAVADNPDVELKQLVSARWSRQVSRDKYRLLKNRYGMFDVAWVANDMMAAEVMDEIENAGDDTVVGGMDWTAEALDAVSEGRMSASMGGHFLDIGLAMAVLKQYDQGCDFAEGRESPSLSSVLSPITPETEKIHAFLREQDWDKLDFSVIDCATVRSPRFGEVAVQRLLATAVGPEESE